MLERFKNFIEERGLFSRTDKVVLAVSGGVDSIVMCDLFHKASFSFAIAHCNFQLRKQESDGDEQFVKNLAIFYNVPFFVNRFDTDKYAQKKNISVQMAARDLRYHWFKELIEKHSIPHLATAHHQDDVAETFFINLIRGSGISGLHGISEKRDYIIRPLLFASKDEISEYAKKRDLKYREDSSNLCDKYTRNKIRHHVIPIFKEINPNALNSIISTIERLKEVESVFKETIDIAKKKLVLYDKNQTKISIVELKKLQPIHTYIFELLKEFGFNASTINSIESSLDSESGKVFYSPTHKLIKDRNQLIITNYQLPTTNWELSIKDNITEIEDPIPLKFELAHNTNFIIPKSNCIACLDYDSLKFPLTLRRWKQGDSFNPLGMKGKKKLSDFFIDKKISLADKENTWVLCSADAIVWVVGYRIDEGFKVKEGTKQIYKIQCL